VKENYRYLHSDLTFIGWGIKLSFAFAVLPCFLVTGQFSSEPTRSQSSLTRGLVNSPKCLLENLEHVIYSELYYVYAGNIR